MCHGDLSLSVGFTNYVYHVKVYVGFELSAVFH